MCLSQGADRVSRKYMRGENYLNNDDRRSGCNNVFDMEQLMGKYADVFEDGGFYSVDSSQMVRIDVDYNQLVAPPYYPVSLNLQEAVMDKIRWLESIVVLREQFSEFKSPVVAVRKSRAGLEYAGTSEH